MNFNIDREKETKALIHLQRYYLGEISFQRVAYEAKISVYELLEIVRKYGIRMVGSDRDRILGLKRVCELLEERGIKSVLSYARELAQA